jgi:hypothetical protein
MGKFLGNSLPFSHSALDKPEQLCYNKYVNKNNIYKKRRKKL